MIHSHVTMLCASISTFCGQVATSVAESDASFWPSKTSSSSSNFTWIQNGPPRSDSRLCLPRFCCSDLIQLQLSPALPKHSQGSVWYKLKRVLTPGSIGCWAPPGQDWPHILYHPLLRLWCSTLLEILGGLSIYSESKIAWVQAVQEPKMCSKCSQRSCGKCRTQTAVPTPPRHPGVWRWIMSSPVNLQNVIRQIWRT